MDGTDRDRVVVRAIPAAETRALRQLVLRPGQPLEATVYPGDDAEATVHFGAYVGSRLVGIASMYGEQRPQGDGDTSAWRLRGMASAPEARGRGIGRALLRACVSHVAARGGGELWCNARVAASGFYANAGFEVVSEPFEVEGIGPHVVMRRLVLSGRA